MLGIVLLYVGGVLFINGLTMLDRIAVKEAAIMNLFAGGISLFVNLHQISSNELPQMQAAAFGLLFSLTYLWVAYTNWTGLDGRGLGWFSLFVSITAAMVTVDALASAESTREWWMATNWASWTLLWFCYFVIGALKRRRWVTPVAWLTIVQSVMTAWLPGYLLLTGRVL